MKYHIFDSQWKYEGLQFWNILFVAQYGRSTNILLSLNFFLWELAFHLIKAVPDHYTLADTAFLSPPPTPRYHPAIFPSQCYLLPSTKDITSFLSHLLCLAKFNSSVLSRFVPYMCGSLCWISSTKNEI